MAPLVYLGTGGVLGVGGRHISIWQNRKGQMMPGNLPQSLWISWSTQVFGRQEVGERGEAEHFDLYIAPIELGVEGSWRGLWERQNKREGEGDREGE